MAAGSCAAAAGKRGGARTQGWSFAPRDDTFAAEPLFAGTPRDDSREGTENSAGAAPTAPPAEFKFDYAYSDAYHDGVERARNKGDGKRVPPLSDAELQAIIGPGIKTTRSHGDG